MSQSLQPIHPGEVLLEEFMKPKAITPYRLAKETDVPARRLNDHGGHGASARKVLRNVGDVLVGPSGAV